MKNIKSIIINALVIVVTAVLVFGILELGFSDDDSQSESGPSEEEMAEVSLDLVAVGDSLTEGVGDSTQRGGFVPLVSDQLRMHPNVQSVQTQNFGNAGDTSSQILTKLSNEELLRNAVTESNVITLTVGGNDIVHTFGDVGINASFEDFSASINEYKNNVQEILSTIHVLNPNALIYIIGLYNPYHYYFSEFSELQEVFDNWNATTEQLADQQERVRFVAVDALFNPAEIQGDIEENVEDAENLEELEDENHPYLYEGDLFHPNDAGYQIMADALYDQIQQDLSENLNLFLTQ